MLLKFGLLPGESTPVVLARNQALRAHLERALDIEVELVVGATYAATGEALRQGRIDIAFLGPVAYALQSRRAPLEPFARPTHARVGPTFQAVILVPADSPVRSLADLRGQDIALGDLASTSGSWVPRYQLLEAGLMADRDYARRMLGAHDKVALAVAQRTVAAGGLSKPIYLRLLQEGRLDPDAVRVLAVSPAIPEYMWTFRAGMDPVFSEALRQAFVRIRDPQVLAVYRAESFIPAVDSDVDRVRHWMEAILQARLGPSPLPWTPIESMIRWNHARDNALAS